MVTITAPVMKITRTLAQAMTAGFGEASLDKFGVHDCVQLTRYAPAALWNPDQYFALRIHRRCPRLGSAADQQGHRRPHFAPRYWLASMLSYVVAWPAPVVSVAASDDQPPFTRRHLDHFIDRYCGPTPSPALHYTQPFRSG